MTPRIDPLAYAAVFEHTLDAVLLATPEGGILDANPAACLMFGRTRDEICRIGRAGLVDPASPEFARILQDRSTYGSAHGELWLVRADGSRFPADLTVAAFTGENHERRVAMIVRDATARRQVEDTLRESAARFRSLIESSPLPYALLDRTRTAMYVNPAFVETFGYELSDVPTVEHWWRLAYPDEAYRARVQELWRTLSATGETPEGRIGPAEVTIRCKDGSMRTTLVSTHAVDADGTGTLAVTFHDITDRVEAERERRLAAVITDNMAEGAAIVRAADLTIIHVTAQFARLFGYAPDELLGQHVSVLNAADGRSPEDVAHAIIEELRTRRTWTGEIANRRKDGTTFWSLASVSSYLHPVHGEVWVSVHQDITERRRHEEARLNSQRLEALGTLAGGIAHDFNNLLTAIRGNAELAAADAEASTPLAANIDEVLRASRRAQELVRRITAFGRPKHHDRRVTDLRPVVDEVLHLLRSAIPARISLETRYAGGGALVNADAGQVHEAVVNLTTNAAYAIGSGTGTIEYSIDRCVLTAFDAERLGLTPGPYVRLTVKDNGAGMDEATRARAFDAFFTTKPQSSGTGLGLSMVFGIMRGHDGAVDVESRPGAGATFRLYFPPASAVHDEASATLGAYADVASHPLRILHVDDEPSLVLLMERALGRMGHTVHGFTDPFGAIAQLRDDPHGYDVVLSDLTMPRMSGFEVAEEIRRIRPDIGIVLSTGYTEGVDDARVRELDIDDVVQKPPAMPQLVQTLDRVVARRARQTRASDEV